MKNISKNITFENWIDYKGKEFFKIENTPTKQQIENGKLIAENIYEVLNTKLNSIINVETGFLNSDLCMKISLGLPYHNGDALKISSSEVSNYDIFNYIKDNLDFDVLIWLFGSKENPQSIYVSYNKENKKQVLRTKYNKDLKKVEYISYEQGAI